MICKYYLPFSKLPFHSVDGSFAVQKLFGLMQAQLFIFAFVASAFGIKLNKIIAKINVKEFTPYVCFDKFYSFRSCAQVLNTF